MLFPGCSGQCVAKIYTFVHVTPHFILLLPKHWKMLLNTREI